MVLSRTTDFPTQFRQFSIDIVQRNLSSFMLETILVENFIKTEQRKKSDTLNTSPTPATGVRSHEM